MNRVEVRNEIGTPKTASEIVKKVGWSGLVELVNWLNKTGRLSGKWTIRDLEDCFIRDPQRLHLIAKTSWRLHRSA